MSRKFTKSFIKKSRGKSKRKEAGFSLIEVLITMVIFLTVSAAIYQVLKLSQLQRATVSTQIDAVKSARIALNYIRRDAVNAGLGYHNVGGVIPDNFLNKLVSTAADADTDTDRLTGIISGNDVNANNLNPGGITQTDSIGFVTRDLSFNDGKSINVTATSASGADVIVQTGANQAVNAKKFDLYLIESESSQVVGIVTEEPASSSFILGFGTAVDPLNINLAANGTGSSKSLLVGANVTGSLKKINLVTYSVTPEGVLVRKTYGNNTGELKDKQIQTRELIYNVQNLQVTYLMADGTVSSNPTSGNSGWLNQQKMNQVIQIEIRVTVMQSDAEQRVSSPVTITEVISTKNLRYTIN